MHNRSYEFWVKTSSIVTMVMVSLMIGAKTWAWLASGSASMLGSIRLTALACVRVVLSVASHVTGEWVHQLRTSSCRRTVHR